MSARDVVLIGVVLFAIAMGFFIIHFTASTAVDQMLLIETINESDGAVTAFGSIDTVVNRLDYVVFALFIGLILALMITGWFIGGNPIFMFIYFIVVVIGTVLATVLANVWEDISGASIFGSTLGAFPISNNLMLNLPLYVGVAGFIGMIVMFAKPYFQNE